MAVQTLCYEVRMRWLAVEDRFRRNRTRAGGYPSALQLEGYQHLEQTLQRRASLPMTTPVT